ncbi:MAG: FAD-dependent monooxygenase [Pseudomonadota bacterium]
MVATVAIAGAGIAGVAAGLALARAGWSVCIVEQAPELGEVGAGLQMSPNATRVLDWLGVLDVVSDGAFHPQAAVMKDGRTGEEIYRAALGQGAQDRWGSVYLHVHRADLLNALARAAERAGVTLRLGTQVERVVEHPDSASLHLSNGTVLKADLVIGADGIRSRLRQAFNVEEEPRFTGQVAWRGLIPADRVPADLVAPDVTVWAGDARHLVTYYLRGGDLINFIAVQEQDDWVEESWSVPGDPDGLRAAFSHWDPKVRALLDQVDTCYLWGLFDRPEQVRWVDHRFALIGDAAHPMLPFMAQGAAQALEDVASLVRHLGDGDDIEPSLVRWEEERWPRVARIMKQSRDNGRMFHRPEGTLRTISRSIIGFVSRTSPSTAAARLDWLYGYDPVRGRG